MTQEIVGHGPLRTVFRRLIQRGRLPSTLLFVGSEGIGKSLVARDVARQILCDSPSDEGTCLVPEGCASCRLTHAGNHPDLMYGDARAEDMDIESLRLLLRRLNLSSFHGRGRVVILDNADLFSAQSLNLLLKTLEEPRPATWFILLSSNPARFPATIPSRCTLFRFSDLSENELQLIIEEGVRQGRYPENTIPSDILSLSEGRVIRPDEIPLRLAIREMVEEFHDALAQSRYAESIRTIQAILKEYREQIDTVLALLRLSARARLRAGNEAQPRWAAHLLNILMCERLVAQRNLNPSYLLVALTALEHRRDDELPLLNDIVAA